MFSRRSDYWLDELLDLQEEALGSDYHITCRTRHDLTEYYSDTNLNDKAMFLFQYNLPIWKSRRNKNNEAVTLLSIGKLYAQKGEIEDALFESLAIKRGIKNRIIDLK